MKSILETCIGSEIKNISYQYKNLSYEILIELEGGKTIQLIDWIGLPKENGLPDFGLELYLHDSESTTEIIL